MISKKSPAPTTIDARGQIPSTDNVRDWARYYHRLGWSIIPIQTKSKKPVGRWSQYQTKRMLFSKIDTVWGRPQVGIAVVHGPVSSGLACRDFDGDAGVLAFMHWNKNFRELASRLPIQKTKRGFHVYFLLSPDLAASDKFKGDSKGAMVLANGELRASCGCYTLLAPSEFVGGDGRYSWVIRPTAENLIEIDPWGCGLVGGVLQTPQTLQHLQDLKRNTKTCLVGPGSRTSENARPPARTTQNLTLQRSIERAIDDTQPPRPGTRNRSQFELVRRLLAIPELAHHVRSDWKELRPIFDEWFQRAKRAGMTETSYDEAYVEFAHQCKCVRLAADESPLNQAIAIAKSKPFPPWVTNLNHTQTIHLLVVFCAELQFLVGDKEFFLSQYDAATLLGLTGEHAPRQAGRLLKFLCKENILQLVESGKSGRAGGRANSYRCLFTPDGQPLIRMEV